MGVTKPMKPRWRNYWGWAPGPANRSWRRPMHHDEDPAQPKIKINYNIFLKRCFLSQAKQSQIPKVLYPGRFIFCLLLTSLSLPLSSSCKTTYYRIRHSDKQESCPPMRSLLNNYNYCHPEPCSWFLLEKYLWQYLKLRLITLQKESRIMSEA